MEMECGWEAYEETQITNEGIGDNATSQNSMNKRTRANSYNSRITPFIIIPSISCIVRRCSGIIYYRMPSKSPSFI
jgi:hypothetical protein